MGYGTQYVENLKKEYLLRLAEVLRENNRIKARLAEIQSAGFFRRLKWLFTGVKN